MSPPKTTGKTGETGKPSIDAGFRASGLQKPNREKPGIRGAGDDGLGAEMAALALPESDPPTNGPGRPKGTTRGPSKAVQEFLRKTIRGVIEQNLDFATAARKSESAYKNPERAAHKNRQLYPDFFWSEFAKILRDANIKTAESIAPGLRKYIEDKAAAWATTIDCPGHREAARSIRDNPQNFAQAFIDGLTSSLERLWLSIYNSSADENTKDEARQLLTKIWRETAFNVVMRGPKGRS